MNIQLHNKKEAIFESTLHLIYEYGFRGTPMSQIANHANVATGTIYHYFASKDELILELFKYCREQTNEHIFSVDKNLPYKERFFFIWKRLVAYYLDHKEIFRFVEQFYSSPYFAIMQSSQDPSYYGVDKLHQFFEEGAKSGIIREMNFPTIVSVYIGPATSYIKNISYGFCKMTDSDRDNIIEIIWNGVKK
ncbi:TetR/AcrR family transcriptional regulator [Sphingobacterium wenxiniae]|uniref:DNA-binding transcriptional regulator, AcrR family n=1 Tax=Sphingobacterium wenxiniae TaxID=683125 RepID=A0A1I6STE1_9SPHI|nr:TetR/AcrR family transcriptional regulator [Sphingobacterium wenxiniae]SFS80190.1 DNA-binding transcriptional regulator, AcrR family [Sphingobacterium wenxiniae]